MLLKELYELKLIEYKTNGSKEHPSKLLAMLLLPEMDNYLGLRVEEGKFYEKYKFKIDEKIAQVENDFCLTKEEIIQYIRNNGVRCDDYNHDKIWYVFSEGFGAMHWGLMYQPDKTPEEIYSEYFDNNELLIYNDDKISSSRFLQKNCLLKQKKKTLRLTKNRNK